MNMWPTLRTIALLFLSLTLPLHMAEAKKPETKAGAKTVKLETAIFAGGCFWCMQPPFDKLDGVVATTVGFCGGSQADPSYKDVAAGKTTHAEAIEVSFDPKKVSYEKLLEVFWRNIDPTTKDRQFADVGPQYRTAIFYLNGNQKQLAEKSKQQLEESKRFDKPIVTEITTATKFYPAEDDHQKYYLKNPLRYKLYRKGSGRDRFLKRVWGSDS